MPLFLMYWRRTLKRPAVVILWASIPFVFMTIYMLAFGSSGNIAPARLLIVDRDSTFASRFLGEAFRQGALARIVSVEPVGDLEEAEKLFRKDLGSAALVIPKGFSHDLIMMKDVELTLYKNPRHYINPQILEGVTDVMATLGNGLLRTFADPLQSIEAFIEGEKEPTEDAVADVSSQFYRLFSKANVFQSFASVGVHVVEKKKEKKFESNMAAYFLPGLLVFSLLSLSLSLEARLLMDRINKLNYLIVAAPKKAFSLVMSQRFYSMTFLYFVTIVCGAAGGLIWHIAPVGLFKANIMMISVILFIVGTNATIFSLTKSRRGSAALSSFVMIFLIMVGGGVMPVEIYPKTLQKIAHFTPTGLANTGIVESITGREVSISMPLLFIYGSAFLVLSILVGRRRLVERG